MVQAETFTALRMRAAMSTTAGSVERPAIEWESRLAAAGVPVGAVRSVPELLDEEQVSVRELFRNLALPEQGRDAVLPTAGFKLNGRRIAPERSPPLLAADNDDVLAELGYDASQRRSLREDGVW